MARGDLLPARRESRWRTGAGGLPIPRLGRNLRDQWLAFLMVLPALTLMSVYVLYPLYQVIVGSFSQTYTLGVAPHWVGLQNFRDILAGGAFFPALARSLYYTGGNIVLQLVLGLAFALLLNQNLPGRNVARGAVLFPFIVPAVVAALIWTYALDPLTGVVNFLLLSNHLIKEPLQLLSAPGTSMNTVILISTWKYMPLIIILFLARLQTIPTEVVEAAKCDGANVWQVAWHVTWPWLQPVVLVAVMARTILSFNEFEMPYLLAHGGPLGTVNTLPVLVRELLNDEVDLGRAAAVSLLMMLILAVVLSGYIYAYRRGEKGLEG